MDSITNDFSSVVRTIRRVDTIKPPLKAFLVTYDGLWLGGTAVVLADSPDAACDMVREHRITINFEDVQAVEVGQGDKEGVLFNDNGNY